MIPQLSQLLLATGDEVTDAEEEAFLLFSQDIPTGNLGFIDSHATSVEVAIRGNEYTIHQSPTLLSSSRAGGTTGAVLWKITPLFADWISSPTNPLWTHGLLSPASVVAELGCGISALLALTLAPSISHYLATDQEYVRRLFHANLEENAAVKTHPSPSPSPSPRPKGPKARSSKSAKKSLTSSTNAPNITFTTLDWESDEPRFLKDYINSNSSRERSGDRAGDEDGHSDGDRGFDLLLSCDCIYNEALVASFVRTCADICRLRPAFGSSTEEVIQSRRPPTMCIVAQQQRSPEVFETWLRETLREFRVWRLSDEVLGDGLKGGTGYLVHLLLLREKR